MAPTAASRGHRRGAPTARPARAARVAGSTPLADRTLLGGVTLLAAAILLAATACDGPTASTDLDDLVGPTWEVRLIRTAAGDVEPVDASPRAPSITFTAEEAEGPASRRLEGAGGCNWMFGRYATGDGGDLEIGGLGWTEMACQPAGVMEFESLYFESLAGVRRFQVRDGTLLLQFEGGRIELMAGGT